MTSRKILRACAEKYTNRLNLKRRSRIKSRPIFELTPLEQRVLLSNTVTSAFTLSGSSQNIGGVICWRGGTVTGTDPSVAKAPTLDVSFVVYTFNEWKGDTIQATVKDGNGNQVGQASWTFGNSWHVVQNGQDSSVLYNQSFPQTADHGNIYSPGTDALTDVDHDNDQLGRTICGNDNIFDPAYIPGFSFSVDPATTNYNGFTITITGPNSTDNTEYFGVTNAEISPGPTCNCYAGQTNANGQGGTSSTADGPSSGGSGSDQNTNIDITDGNSNGLSEDAGVAGNNTVMDGVPSIAVTANQTAVVVDGFDNYWFDYNGSSWVERYGGSDTLVHSGTNYILSDSGGTQTTFSDSTGLASTITAPGGNVTSFSYSGNSLTTISRSSSVGGTTVNEQFNYSYLPSSDPNSGKLESISLTRQVGSGSWNGVQQSIYSYYGSGASGGTTGDLAVDQIEDVGPVVNNTPTLSSGGSAPTTTLYYQVTAVLPNGESAPSTEVAITPTSGNQTVNLSWASVPNATAYKIYRGGSSGQEQYLAQATGTTYSDSALSSSGSPPPIISAQYWRYWKSGDSVTENGVSVSQPPGLLKYVLRPASYARLAASLPSGTTPLTASDAQVAPFADDAYEYDAKGRVYQDVKQGTGDSSTDGLGTFKYTYDTSSFSSTDGAGSGTSFTPNYNQWVTKSTITKPDLTVETDYYNIGGHPMLSVTTDATTGKMYGTFTKYDSQDREILVAQPSAVLLPKDLSILESYPDLLNSQANNYEFLSDSSGLINSTTYYSSTTANSTTAGGVQNMMFSTRVQQGELGTPATQEQWTYYQFTSGNSINDPVATDTTYGQTGSSDARTTTYSYTLLSGTAQIQQQTVSNPVISSSQDGPATADTVTTYFDADGRPEWVKYSNDNIDYTAYDEATGATIETITDVDYSKLTSAQQSQFPSTWSQPTGGLHLDTKYVVDSQGRVTKETSPNGNVTYTVYNDSTHETRVYPGFNGTTTTGPIQINA